MGGYQHGGMQPPMGMMGKGGPQMMGMGKGGPQMMGMMPPAMMGPRGPIMGNQQMMGMPGQQMPPAQMQVPAQQPAMGGPSPPLNAAALAAAPPSVQKQMIGEKLFPAIAKY